LGETKPQSKNTAAVSVCGPYRNDKTVTINGQQIQAEIASSATERQKGLSGRPCILPNQAMLFTFSQPGHYSFWMKDMKFPIDIAWISPDKKVVGLEIDVEPSTYPDSFVNKDQPAQYVLELKANRSKTLNINLGTPVKF